jgi:Holliday junction resolvase RusA-like endonuclease
MIDWPVTIILPMVPRSPNRFLGRHWHGLHRDKARWQEAVYYLLTKEQRDEIAMIGHSDRRLGITIVQTRRRRLDRDNLYASVKVVLDGMTRAQLIADDSENHIRLDVRQKLAESTGESTMISFQKER